MLIFIHSTTYDMIRLLSDDDDDDDDQCQEE